MTAGTEGSAGATSESTSNGSGDPETTSISDTADSASSDTTTTTDPSTSTTAATSETDSDSTGGTDSTAGTDSGSSSSGADNSTGMLTASSTTDDSTTGMNNPVGYGDCANNPIGTACITGEGCILDDPGDPTLGVCSDQGCMDATDCPSAPEGGDAVITCDEITGNMTNDCYLDCSNGETCPTGMRCGGGYICIYDLIGADPIGFGDCFNNPAEDACLFDEGCLSDGGMTGSVCFEPGCASPADCPQPPAGGNAPVACTDVTGDLQDECILDCSGAQTCPTGMTCFNNQFCFYQ